MLEFYVVFMDTFKNFQWIHYCLKEGIQITRFNGYIIHGKCNIILVLDLLILNNAFLRNMYTINIISDFQIHDLRSLREKYLQCCIEWDDNWNVPTCEIHWTLNSNHLPKSFITLWKYKMLIHEYFFAKSSCVRNDVNVISPFYKICQCKANYYF